MSDARFTLMEAVARMQIVEARYNGALLRLAPHLIFERHGDLFISALNLSKSWPSDAEQRLGQFKLAGLSDVELLKEEFDPLPSYDGAPPRSDDVAVLAI